MSMDCLVGFGLLCGHMIGDYIFQNDYMAGNKTNTWPGPDPYSQPRDWQDANGLVQAQLEWLVKEKAYRTGYISCTIHCFLYTFAVWMCAFWWMPLWGLIACFLIHWPIDRFRLAYWWMNNVSGQKFFASKEHPMFPNSIILVDNTFHLVTLFVIA